MVCVGLATEVLEDILSVDQHEHRVWCSRLDTDSCVCAPFQIQASKHSVVYQQKKLSTRPEVRAELTVCLFCVSKLSGTMYNGFSGRVLVFC